LPTTESDRRARAAANALRAALAKMDLACGGTIYVRTRKCGKRACRCHEDESARHGPYSEWTRMRGGRLSHSTLSAEQAERLADAIANYREIRRLLVQWELATEAVIVGMSRRNRLKTQ
jgi:hypothetical protein